MLDLALAQMCGRLYELAASTRLDELPLDRWRTDATARHEAQPIVSFIDFLSALIRLEEVDPWSLMIEGRTRTWAEQAAAALAASLW